MPAQHLLVNGCQNTGGRSTNAQNSWGRFITICALAILKQIFFEDDFHLLVNYLAWNIFVELPRYTKDFKKVCKKKYFTISLW